MWGTWWEWGDPRMMSELIMLFPVFRLHGAPERRLTTRPRPTRRALCLALVGAVNVPIVHFSVEWWSSLHQGPTLVREGGHDAMQT